MATLNDYGVVAHELAVEKGFYEGKDPFNVDQRLAKIALMGEELGEMVEAVRKPGNSEKISCTKLEEECADLFIRLVDFCIWTGVDLDRAVDRKMIYNTDRPHMHGKLA